MYVNMEDFTIATLQDSRNEWCAQLINIVTPLIIEGYNSIFDESWTLCEENDEIDKYLMTFQNFITRVPKWNSTIVEKEKQRIVERSKCPYLEDLLTCVHIIQLKALTCIRVGTKQKKIDINIPKLDEFIHKVYIHVARKLYKNIYIYDKHVTPLQKQKHSREFEVIVQECVLNVVRDSMPVDEILRMYLDETHEEEIEETILDEKIPVEDSTGSLDNTSSDAQLINVTVAPEPVVTPVAPEPVVTSTTPEPVLTSVAPEPVLTSVAPEPLPTIVRENDPVLTPQPINGNSIQIKESMDPSLLDIEVLSDVSTKPSDTITLEYDTLE